MASDNKVQIEIILDDGSTKKAFLNIQKQAEDTQSKINNDGKNTSVIDEKASLTSFASIRSAATSSLGLVSIAIASVGLAAKKAFDFTVEGERIQALEKQFLNLADSEGIAGEALLQGLKESSKGLVDVGDLLQKSSGAIISLGKNAERLPEILNLATKSAALLGGTAQQRFEDITRAIENGNQRALRQAGIFLDTDQVFKKFAATLGTTSTELTQAQKQFALLNAAIDVGNEKFKNVTNELTPVSNAYTRFGVALKETADEILKSFSNTFGPAFTALLNRFTESLNGFLPKDLARDTAQIELKISGLNKTIEELKNKLIEIDEAPNFFDRFNRAATLTNLGRANQALSIQVGLLNNIKKEQEKVAASAVSEAVVGSSVGSSPGLTPEQVAANAALQKQANDQITAIQLQASQQRIALKEQELATTTSLEDQEKLRAEIAFGQFQNTLIQRDVELATVEQQLGQNRLVSLEQREAARAAIISKYNGIIQSTTTDAQKVVAQREAQIANSFKQGIVNSVSAAAASIGNSLAKGKLDFDDFGRSILNVLADTAIQLGALVISFGVASTALGQSLATFNGAGAIAAGAALIAIGTAIKAFAGGPGSGAAGVPSAGTPGGSPIQTDQIGGDFSQTPIEDTLERQSPTTEVVVNIQGDVLDSEDTGLRIVDIINSAFDKQGVIIKRGALA